MNSLASSFAGNCWYVIAWVHELGAVILFKGSVLGEPILLSRTSMTGHRHTTMTSVGWRFLGAEIERFLGQPNPAPTVLPVSAARRPSKVSTIGSPTLIERKMLLSASAVLTISARKCSRPTAALILPIFLGMMKMKTWPTTRRVISGWDD